jgi:signal transduction histidine kinase
MPEIDSQLRALSERNDLLESLSDVGVSLAGSFDIQAILQTTHDAASRFSDCSSVDVLYFGCEAINSRPMWCPAEPSTGGLDHDTRDAIVARFAQADRSHDIERHLPSATTRCLPISYQDEQLGFLFLDGASISGAEIERVLAILTLQAATALRNIHLTQERIHFERLSAVGRMIGSVVHDFRSPLTALRGYAGMLTKLELDEGERAAYGRYVVEECDRLNHMVNELLEFTRGGSLTLEPERVHLPHVIDALAERVHAHYAGRGILVELDLDETSDVEIDKARMDRALWNVATNACQAMPQGGVLKIRTAQADGAISLSFVDEGTGIPDEVRHRIFEPFFSYGKSEGIGLGMLIARKVAEEHGGTIAVTSNEGAGTCVTFEIPTRVAENAPPVEAATEKR